MPYTIRKRKCKQTDGDVGSYVLRYTDIIFSPDEMAMLGGIIGFWFGSRGWSKK